MDRYICVHGHFYQPPRENPWLEEIELQEEAYPYHDWNEKITAECYAPNAASRILNKEGRIVDITNIYSKISFDFGPTLLSWLDRHKPDIYEAILEADRLSMKRFSGHGSAMAQAYNHMIMPLANKRDKYTQTIWGIKDFEKRFNRLPEGMWLPETAVDIETLETLVDHGIKFTVLSPRQAKRICRIEEEGNWRDVSGEKVDPTMAYQCSLPSGRTISFFFYDGPVSQAIAFSELLKSGEAFANKLISAFNEHRDWPQIVNIATDGETFGHHHRFGDMALSYCLHHIESNNLAKITNYGEYLEKHPPDHIVEIFENSSWSCVHGVERWRDNCGCNTGMHQGWNQAWRGPLRNAMDWLRNQLIHIFEDDRVLKHFNDPWELRNDYIGVILDRSRNNVQTFFKRRSDKALSQEEKVRVLRLLEMQRNAILMYTSCGWFFDEVSGTEAVQVMRYASKAIQYAEELTGLSLESEYLQYLQKAPSNIFENAAIPYEMFVKRAGGLIRVGAHYCISSIFEEYAEDIKICCYTEKSRVYNKIEAGKLKLATGKSDIASDITWDKKTIMFAVLHLGDHNINAGVREFTTDGDFSIMESEVKEAFEKGDIPEVIRLMDKHFDGNIYSLWHLFKDEQIKILNQILQLTYEDIETSYRQTYENNYTIMNYFHSLGLRLPRPFASAVEYVLNTDLKRVFENGTDLERLIKLIDEAERWSVRVDTTTVEFVVGKWINSIMEGLNENAVDLQPFETICRVMDTLKPLSLYPDIWKAQNVFFSVGRDLFRTMKTRAAKGDREAEKGTEIIPRLGECMNVKI